MAESTPQPEAVAAKLETQCSISAASANSANSANSSGDESRDESQKSDKDKDKMARHNTSRPFPPRRPELDLSAMLNLEQSKQLQVLVQSVLDSMQEHIREPLDNLSVIDMSPDEGIKPPRAIVTSIPNPRSEKYRAQYGDIGLPAVKPDFEDRDLLRKIMKSVPPPIDSTTTPQPTLFLPKSAEEASAMSGKTQNEIVMSSLSELKRDVLAQFGKWRIVVTRRVNDIVIKNGGTGGNVVRQGPQHASGNARRVGNAAGGRPARPPELGVSSNLSNTALVNLHPPLYTALTSLPKEKRALILHSMMLLLLGLDQYSSHTRTVLLKIASSLHIPAHVLLQDEYRVSQALAQIVKGISAEEVARKRAEEGKPPKRWRGAGLSIMPPGSITGNLAEPLIVAGIGTVFGGVGLSTTVTAHLLGGIGAAESTVPVGTLFGLYGARQGGKAMDAYTKDVQDFALIPMHGSMQSELIDPKDVPAENRRMRVTIGISGWTTVQDDFRQPWKVLGQLNEVYALRWELEALMKVGISLQTVVNNAAWSAAKKEVVNRTVFESLQKAHWPTGLLKASKVVDNPWTVALVRAEKAGQVLAEILTNKMQGERAVNLIGYGIGARIIYTCLMALAEKRAFGIIENAVLIGAPCPSTVHVWASMRSVVAGRLVNVFSKNDYLLGFLYRSCAWQYGVAGLQTIAGVPKVENSDFSNIVANHLQYQYLVGSILRRIGWEDIDYDQVDNDANKLAVMVHQERKLDQERDEKVKARALREQQEKAAQEKVAREKAAQEEAVQEKVAREKAAREKAAREKAAREKAARDKAAREKAAKDKAAKEKADKELKEKPVNVNKPESSKANDPSKPSGNRPETGKKHGRKKENRRSGAQP
ncbi:Uu.00g074620.m01.CDS01 [Anthostomella pinea]|uniref:Uu.00g074620.m01.CDS01 n=1 Tax=Anthostomella pinea TaxID=933095 RepID=A0AAI8YLN5_9PEZI|nr:Uu.00g074620.m01.CDS01 [Anthostomella pinea]